jgi:hypothetical protein
LGYLVSDKIFIALNTDTIGGSFNNVILPDDTQWKLIANIAEVNLENGITDDIDIFLDGGRTYNLTLSAESLKIWIRK